ncbi:MAG: L,D-transpeptidase family protein [Pseudomonadota bacterium]|nr:L,D-transpeptidase family protein [Pseudomonadota bacterium]
MLGAVLVTYPLRSMAIAGAHPVPAHAVTGTRFFWHPEIAPSGPLVMVVSLDEQYLYVYRNGMAIGASPISSGRPGHETPTGVYTILQKEREHRSNLYNDAPMPFMQRLSWDGIAMHGGYLPGHPASHGCIRLPQSFAEKLFEISQRGAVVVIANARVDPATIVHPAAVAPIDLSGQPMATPLGDVPLPVPADRRAPLSVVISTHDHAVYVLRDGQLVATTTLGLNEGPPFRGTVLYVLRGDTAAAGDMHGQRQTAHLWSAYRIIDHGPVAEPAQLAAQLRVPAAFGQSLREQLVPGTTVLVTDLPGYGGTEHTPYGSLLESDLQAAPAQRGPGR